MNESESQAVIIIYHSVARQCYTVVRATQQVNGKWQFGGVRNP